MNLASAAEGQRLAGADGYVAVVGEVAHDVIRPDRTGGHVDGAGVGQHAAADGEGGSPAGVVDHLQGDGAGVAEATRRRQCGMTTRVTALHEDGRRPRRHIPEQPRVALDYDRPRRRSLDPQRPPAHHWRVARQGAADEVEGGAV